MDDLTALRSLAQAMGVHTRYIDGLKRRVTVGPDTLVRVCAALGAPIERPGDAADCLRAREGTRRGNRVPPVVVAWDGKVPAFLLRGRLQAPRRLPMGYHRVTVENGDKEESCTVISAPVHAWHRPGSRRSWGVGTQLAALRSRRSRSLGDLKDLESLARWVGERGGDVVTVLPLSPTFNGEWPEPSPYSGVSRLFWSELVLDLGDAHRPVGPVTTLDVQRADAEVRAALAERAAPDPASLDQETIRYARFRGAQAKLGRNWRAWPADARGGRLGPEHVDVREEKFHLTAQAMVRRQLQDLRQRLDRDGIRLGLDLAVGVHPDGYDPWSRQSLFGHGMSVGAPPDYGFPSGQDWGFSPVLPEASRREGHQYLAASIAHQMELAGVLRVDHVMAWTRLYWIPHGFELHQGTYVSYPADELFAILTLESHRHHCEVVGENLGTVPPGINRALRRHRIWGMYLAQFKAAEDPKVPPPGPTDMALVGTHDTPTLAGWLAANDISERVGYKLLSESAVPAVRKERTRATGRLARRLRSPVDQPADLLAKLLEWLGRSQSPLFVPWLEDLWLEPIRVNLPGTRSSERPNWQRPSSKLLDEVFADAEIDVLLRRLNHARTAKRARRTHT